MAVDPRAAGAVARQLDARGVPAGADLIVVHVSAGNPFRRWPETAFAELMGRTVRSAESDRDIELPTAHGEHVRRVVHYLIESDERKAKCHEFNDRSQPDHRRADAHAGKSVLADWRVDDSLRAEAFE